MHHNYKSTFMSTKNKPRGGFVQGMCQLQDTSAKKKNAWKHNRKTVCGETQYASLQVVKKKTWKLCKAFENGEKYGC